MDMALGNSQQFLVIHARVVLVFAARVDYMRIPVNVIISSVWAMAVRSHFGSSHVGSSP